MTIHLKVKFICKLKPMGFREVKRPECCECNGGRRYGSIEQVGKKGDENLPRDGSFSISDILGNFLHGVFLEAKTYRLFE